MRAKRLRKSDLLLFCIPLLIPILYVGVSVAQKRFTKTVISNVETFPDDRSEQIAVVKRLSQLLKEYPHATTFKIQGNYPRLRKNGTVVYIRNWKNKPRHWHGEKYGDNTLHFDENLPSTKRRLYRARGNMLDEDIHSVAQKSGIVNEVFTRAATRSNRLNAAREQEEKKLGVQIDFYGNHHPPDTFR